MLVPCTDSPGPQSQTEVWQTEGDLEKGGEQEGGNTTLRIFSLVDSQTVGQSQQLQMQFSPLTKGIELRLNLFCHAVELIVIFVGKHAHTNKNALAC